MSMHPAKTQISLASAQSDQSLRCPHEEPWVLCYQLSAKRRLWSDWADAQADMSLRWAHTHCVGFVMSWLTLCRASCWVILLTFQNTTLIMLSSPVDCFIGNPRHCKSVVVNKAQYCMILWPGRRLYSVTFASGVLSLLCRLKSKYTVGKRLRIFWFSILLKIQQ